MKKIFLLAFATSIFFNLFATTRRVNNNPGVSAPYTSFSAAYTASAVGDTIIVEPSTISHGNVTISKRLTLIGNGYFLDTNQLQVNTNLSLFDNINLFPAASGSQFMGLTIDDGFNLDASDVTLTRCFIRSINANPTLYISGNNNIIQSNYIRSYGAPKLTIDGNNNILSNNIILSQFEVVANSSNNLLENNLIWINGGGTPPHFLNNTNVTIRNNLFSWSEFIDSGNVIFENNGFEFHIPGCDGSVACLVPENYYDSNLTDADFAPHATMLNQGYYGNGDDIGPFNDGIGRPTYLLSGIPAIPTVYSLNLGAANGNNLPVTLGTRTNN